METERHRLVSPLTLVTIVIDREIENRDSALLAPPDQILEKKPPDRIAPPTVCIVGRHAPVEPIRGREPPVDDYSRLIILPVVERVDRRWA